MNTEKQTSRVWKSCGRKLEKIVFAAVTVVSVSIGFSAQDSPSMKTLSLAVSTNNSRSNENRIEVTVEIVNTNTVGDPVEIITIEGVEPFSLRIYDAQGLDINRFALQNRQKDRTHKESKLRFMPSEKKRFSVTISTVDDEKGKAQRISPGVYSVQAVLPIVSYAQGKYNTKLMKSEPVKIEVR